MSNKYYAVRIGRSPGIYTSWDEAKNQVHGFKGAIYKSFKTLDEAKKFLNSNDSTNLSITELNQQIEKEISNLSDKEVIAFVDGSYTNKTNQEKVSYGAILITNEKVYELSAAFSDSESLESHNVSGELYGAGKAIEWALVNNKEKIKIYYDYEGIEKWATGEWKSKINLTKRYVSFINENKEKIQIHFQKVPAHSGIKYNERVDKLAKEALED